MTAPAAIPSPASETPPPDFDALRAEGIALVQRLAGETWTDHNLHDPGITILEQLCYALTDLLYRTGFSIPDLLARTGEDSYASLPGPERILTSRAVTRNDLRCLVLDGEGVCNAWVEPVAEVQPALYYDATHQTIGLAPVAGKTAPVPLKGLYRVSLVPQADADPDRCRQAATRDLHGHRNLGEDLLEVLVPEWQAIAVTAQIEIAPTDHPESVWAAVYRALADHVSPPVRRHGLDELSADGMTMESIFTGPLPERGFILDADLEWMERRTTLRVSPLIPILMDCPGVRSVSCIRVRCMAECSQYCSNLKLPCKTTEQTDKDKNWAKWCQHLIPQMAPRLDPGKTSIELVRNGLHIQTYTGAPPLPPPAALPAPSGWPAPPPGRARRLARYRSILHDLPPLYGVGPAGLDPSASPLRVAQARQLQAYLMIFDQLLADGLAQLAGVRELLGFSAAGPRTWFTQALTDPDLPFAELHPGRAPPDADADWSGRNRIANHLLARFAESFPGALSRMAPGKRAALGNASAVDEALVRAKLALLADYPDLGAARGTGMDLLRPAGPDNRSGLERRLRHKLGLAADGKRDFHLVEHILLRPRGVAGTGPVLTGTPSADPFSLQISLVFKVADFKAAQPGSGQQGVLNPCAGPVVQEGTTTEDPGHAFVERIVREEAPAHLRVFVVWLEDMDSFATAYENWAQALCQWTTGSVTDPAALNTASGALCKLLGLGQPPGSTPVPPA